MLLYSVYGGSKLYNLETPDSDQDIRGIFIEPSNVFFSLDTMEYYEDTESDTVMYSLRKFITLALKNNPSTLELLFAPQDKWLMYNGIWHYVRQHRFDILSSRAIKTYKGWLLQAYDALRAGKSNRVHLLEKYGYDTKEASHILRLAYNIRDIRLYGDFNPSLSGMIRDIVYAAKKGVYTREWIFDKIEHMLEDIDIIRAPLLLEPNYQEINDLVRVIQKTVLTNELL